MALRDRALLWAKNDWVVNVMATCAAAALIATFTLVLVFGPSINSTTDSIDRGQLLEACRSAYSAEVIDRRTDLDIAASQLRRANAATDYAQIAVTRDAVFEDGPNISPLLAVLEAAGQEEIALTAVVADAEQALLDANATYQRVNDLSRSDSDRFLTRCRTDQ